MYMCYIYEYCETCAVMFMHDLYHAGTLNQEFGVVCLQCKSYFTVCVFLTASLAARAASCVFILVLCAQV